MLKRDLSHELFSREPEGWAKWAGFARIDTAPAGSSPPPPPGNSGKPPG